MMCRAYQATEPVAKGPIIVAMDESGSLAEAIYHRGQHAVDVTLGA